MPAFLKKEDATVPAVASKNNNNRPYQELVTELNDNDVLCGRGGRINNYPGNVQFREICRQYQGIYISDATKKKDKIKITSKRGEAMPIFLI